MKQYFALAVLNSLFKVPARSGVQYLIGRRHILLKFLLVLVVFGGMWQGVKATNPEPIVDTVWNIQLAAPIYNVKFLPGDSLIFVAGGNVIFIVETKSGKVLNKYVNDLELTSSSLNFNGDKIYVPTKSKNNKLSIRVFDIKARKFHESFDGDVEMIISISVAPDERYIATNCSTFGLGLWNTQIHNFEKFIKIDGFEQVFLEFSSDNKYLCSGLYYNAGHPGSEYTETIIYSYSDFQLKFIKKDFGGILLNSGKRLIALKKNTSNIYQLEIYEVDSLKLIKTTNFESLEPWGGGPPTPLAISKNDRFLVTSSYSNITRVWDLEQEINVVNYRIIPDDELLYIAISSNMKYILGGTGGHLVLLNTHWEPNTVRDNSTDSLKQISITIKDSFNSLSMELFCQITEPLNMSIVSINGASVYQKENIPTNPGRNNLEIQIPNLPSGEYLITLVGKRNKYFGKFIIVK